MKVGGFSENQNPNQHVNELVQSKKDQIFAKIDGSPGSDINVISFQSQVVNGTNYNIKIEAAGKQYSVKIYEALPAYGGQAEVQEVKAL
jgi:hypothetical protein